MWQPGTSHAWLAGAEFLGDEDADADKDGENEELLHVPEPSWPWRYPPLP